MINTYLDFDGNIYVSSNRAGEITGYSNDYVEQLALAKKIKAKKIGRAWFVEKNSILEHKQSNVLIQKQAPVVPSKYISKVPLISLGIEKRFFLPAIISIFVVIMVVLLPYGFFDIHKRVALPNIPIYEVKESLVNLYLRTNSKIQNTAQLSIDYVSTVIKSTGVIGTNLFLAMQDSLINANGNFANANNIVVMSLVSVGDFFNDTATKLSVATYEFVNKTYLSVIEFTNGVNRNNIGKNLVLNNSNAGKQFVSQSGLVVYPILDDGLADEKKRENIKERFSDEMTVVFDKTGGSGVITPVFRNNKEQNYSFVLVPISREI